MKKTIFGMMLTFTLIGILFLVFNIGVAPNADSETILYVNPSAYTSIDGSATVYSRIISVPDDYPTIQEAINAATIGDTIFVRNGTYYENIVVDKAVALIGENKEGTIIDGRGATVIQLTADNITISSFTITNGWYGIRIRFSNNNRIFNNIITNNTYTNMWGLTLEYSHNNVIWDNTICNNWGGIGFSGSGGNWVYHNNLINNSYQAKQDSSGHIPAYYSNTWDAGYPLGGNYWSDYTGVDEFSGPNQDEPGSDGIGDTPYVVVIEEENIDHYPLINPWEQTPPDPDFAITASPASLTIPQGTSKNSSIIVRSINGFNQTVQLTVTGVPSGVIATANPEQVNIPTNGSTISTLIVSVDSTVTLGNYTLIIVGTSGALTRSTYITLQITIKYVDLPSNSLPMGIAYNPKNNMVYTALHWGSATYGNGEIAEINVTSLNYTLYELVSWHPDYRYPMPFAVAIDGDGNAWVTIRGFKNTPNHPPPDMYWCIAKFITSTKTFEYIRLNLPSLRSSDTVTFHNGFIWTVNGEYLSKINYTTNTVVGTWDLGARCYRCKGDDDVLWISSVDTNKVFMFNITTNNVEKVITGLDRPLGIAVDSDHVYVAENSQTAGGRGRIAKIDKSSGEIVERLETAMITNEGPYEVYFDTYHNLWWTDNSGHIGSFLANGTKLVYDSKPYCYFMTEVPINSKIWFSCVGSAYIGIIAIPQSLFHQISIIDLTFSSIELKINETVYIYVTVQNNGNFTETFDVSVNYTLLVDPLIGTQTITLEPGATVTLNFTWTTTAAGRYEIKAYTSAVPNDMNPEDNTKITHIYVGMSEGSSETGGLGGRFHMNLIV